METLSASPPDVSQEAKAEARVTLVRASDSLRPAASGSVPAYRLCATAHTYGYKTQAASTPPSNFNLRHKRSRNTCGDRLV